MQLTKPKTLPAGFTLVELLVVIAIIGILVTIGLVSFRTSQLRTRDAQRKSDLRQLGNALELFYSDYGVYPDADASGQIKACPYNAGNSTSCAWDKDSSLTDGKTIYMRQMPQDPGGSIYYYVVANGNQEFKLYARLENTQDSSYPNDYGVSCGNANCNFGISSTNTTP